MRAPSLSDELATVRRALDAAGIATTVDWPDDPPAGKADEVLAWVLREAATNVLRHSSAGACRIQLARDDGQVALTIDDDGIGAPTTPVVRLGGLAGLRDRLAAAGGQLSIDRPGEGFRLVATVPGDRT